MSKLINFSLHTARLDNHEQINQALIDGLKRYIDDEGTRKTHLFNGRYENIYIDSSRIPAIDVVLKAVIEYSAVILNMPASQLRAGLWFNVMNPGDSTTLHQHDDDDELLSAVYYVKVAENSGELHIGKGAVMSHVTPAEGMFAFFPPNMPHEVTENRSQESRISLGINIGPVDNEE